MAEPIMEEGILVNVEGALQPCSFCGRTFLPQPLTKHIKICERNATRKRKTFNSLKQRVEGTELAPFHQRSYLKRSIPPNPPEPSRPSNKWREKHLELVKTIREARGVPTIDMGTPKQSASNTAAGSERCPSCDRQFGPRAFDRHVEWCKERKTRIQKSPADVLLAKERLEARTKYRVPPPKSKRALIREKYSPIIANKTESLSTVKSTSYTSLERSPSIRKPKPLSRKSQSRDHCNEIDLEPQDQLEENLTKSQGKEKIVPKDVQIPVIEPSRSPLPPSRTKLRHKINSVEVNDNIEGITVLPVRMEQGDMQEPKQMVTWKDTVNRSSPNCQKLDQINSKMIKSDSDHFSRKGIMVNNKQCSEIDQNKLSKTIKYNSNKKCVKVRNLALDADFSPSLDTNRSFNESKNEGSPRHANKKCWVQNRNKINKCKVKENGFDYSPISLTATIDYEKHNRNIKGSPKKKHQEKKRGKTTNKELIKFEGEEYEHIMDNGTLKLPFSVSKYHKVKISDKKIENLENNHYNTDCQIIEEENEMYNNVINSPVESVCWKTSCKVVNNKNSSSTQSKFSVEPSGNNNEIAYLIDESLNNNIENTYNHYNMNAKLSAINEKPASSDSRNLEDINKFFGEKHKHVKIDNEKSMEYFQNDVDVDCDKAKIYDNKWKNSDVLCAVQEICNKEKYVPEDDLEGSMRQIRISVDDEYFNSSNKCSETSNLNNKNLSNNIEKNENNKAKRRLYKLEIVTDSIIGNSQNSDLEMVGTLKTRSSNDLVSNSDIPNVGNVTTVSSDNAINNYSSQNTDFLTFDILKSSSIDDTAKGSNNHNSDSQNILDSDSTIKNYSNMDNKFETSVSSDFAIKNCTSCISSLQATKILKSESGDKTAINDSDFENIRILETINSVEEITNNSSENSEFHSLEIVKTNSLNDTVNKSNHDSDFENIEDFELDEEIKSKNLNMLKTISSKNAINISQINDFEKIEILENINSVDTSNKEAEILNNNDEFLFVNLSSLNKKEFVNDKLSNNSIQTIFSKEELFQENSAQECSINTNINKGNKSNPELDVQFSFSRINILHKAHCEETDMESLDCADTNEWNEALSAARLERTTRKCSSEICLETNKIHETIFVTSTHPNIPNKNCDYCEEDEEDEELYEDAIQGDCLEIETNQADRLLEIAGEQFVMSHRSDNDVKFVKNCNKMNVYYSESSEEHIPAKRRKICEDDRNDSPSITTCISPCSSANSNLNKTVYEHSLNENLRKIKLEKTKIEQELDEKDTTYSHYETSDKQSIEVFTSAGSYKSSSECIEISSHTTNPVTTPVGIATEIEGNKTDDLTNTLLLNQCLLSTEIKTDSDIDALSPRLFNIIKSLFQEKLVYGNPTDENMILISKKHCKKLLEIDPHELVPKNKMRLPKLKLRQQSKVPNIKKNEDCKHMMLTLPPLHMMKKEHKSKIPVTKCFGKGSSKKYLPRLYNQHLTFPEIILPSDKQQDYNPFVTAERQLMELLECDDFRPFFRKSSSPPTVQHPQRPHTTANTKSKHTEISKTSKVVKSAENTRKNTGGKLSSGTSKRTSVIDPPTDFQDKLNVLNDDFELIESLINQNYIDNYDINNELNEVNYDNISNKIAKSFFLQSDMNENEHGDVFRKERKYSDDMSSIDPRLINENDNLSIPEHFKIDDQSSNSSNDNITPLISNIHKDKFGTKRSVKNNSSNKMIRSVSLDERDSTNKNLKQVNENKKSIKPTKQTKSVHKSTAALTSSYGSTRNNLGLEKKKTLTSLKRSVSLVDPVKPKNLKNKQDVENYFDEQERKNAIKAERCSPNRQEQNNLKMENTSIVLTHPTAEELFSVDDEMYEEYKKYEEMYLREKQLQMQSEKKLEDFASSGTLTPNDGSDTVPSNLKVSGDSAYSSLNRKAPKVRARSTKLAPLNCPETHSSPLGSPPSSGSENSPKLLKCPSATHRMSKFCHECGNKYPINTAKFCVECGVKRLVL